jgi:hypothetical protein
VIGSSQRPLPTQDNTTYKTKKNFLAPNGIRTRDHSKQAAQTYALDRAATGIDNISLAKKFRSKA